MSYYQPCKYCGANLDPGEECDCRKGDQPELTNNKKKMEDFNYGNNNQDSAVRGLNFSSQ